ncbi:MAG: hypothetical protein HZB46_00415 [Solirubrobacterales bacterium]|nr:hypothetical protein [Solirubrobacterales bacterium]
MSATSAGPAPTRSARAAEAHDAEHGSGWVAFAGTMLAIVGTLNVIYGIAAIDDANVYVGDAKYVFADLNTWGWLLLIVGAVQFLAAFGIWNRAPWARWIGVLSASGNAILQLLFLPAFPFLSLALLAIDVLVIYGLVAYGGRRQAI